MATYGGSSGVSAGYTLSSGPSSSSNVSPAEASHLEGLGYVSIYQFKGIQDLQKRVEKQSDALRDGRTINQYLVFLGVTKDHLAQIDRQRTKMRKHTRITHYTDTRELIVKLPTANMKQRIFHLPGKLIVNLKEWAYRRTVYTV
jgi:hypothetical protein